jgi:uncharacterized coiled-coil protein SlyX
MTLEERIDVLESEMAKLQKRMREMNEMLNEATTTGRNAYAVYARLQNYDQAFTDFNSTLGDITTKIKSFMCDEKFVEEFTDEEIKEWYEQSTLTAKEILTVVRQSFPGTDWDLDKINRCLSGRMKDIKLRSFIGKTLRESSNKSKKAS